MKGPARAWMSIAAAMALHAVAWIVLPSRAPGIATTKATDAIEIVFEPSGTATTEPASDVTPSTEAEGEPTAGAITQVASDAEPAVIAEPTAGADAGEALAVVERGGLAVDRAALRDFDPTVVARNTTRGALEDAARGPSIDDRLDRFLGAHARARPHVSRRPDPVLRPTGDGGYVWEGPLLTARVAPDGLVEFSRGGARGDGLELGGYRVTPDGELVLGPTEAERIERERRERILGPEQGRGGLPADPLEASARVGGGVRFRGLADRIDEAFGNDHLAAEKRWFLARTEAFRDRLAARSRGRAPPPDAGL